MPTDSIKKLREMKSVDDRLAEASQRRAGAAKIGDGTNYYIYVDPDQIKLKASGVGTILHKDKTTFQPGNNLLFSIPYARVSFNGMAFHPAGDIPSDATFPHAVFIQNLLDPDITIVQGIYSALQELRNII